MFESSIAIRPATATARQATGGRGTFVNEPFGALVPPCLVVLFFVACASALPDRCGTPEGLLSSAQGGAAQGGSERTFPPSLGEGPPGHRGLLWSTPPRLLRRLLRLPGLTLPCRPMRVTDCWARSKRTSGALIALGSRALSSTLPQVPGNRFGRRRRC